MFNSVYDKYKGYTKKQFEKREHEKIRANSKFFPHSTQDTFRIATKTGVIVLAVLTVFFQDLALIFEDALRNETTSYILAVPFILVYLIYRKRKMLRAVIPLENLDLPEEIRHLPIIAGITLSTTAILLYWYGSYTFTPLEYHMFALPIFAAGLLLVLFNTQTVRQLAFPIAFLTLLVPPPSEILYTLGSSLSVISSEASHIIISSLGIPSVLTSEYGNPIIQITRPGGATLSFAVDIACSGIYSLLGFLIFAVFIAYIIRDKPRKKLALFFIGFASIYILNITRITTILLIGYHYGEETALQLFHLLGGWFLIFTGALLLLAFAEKILRTPIFPKPAQQCSGCTLKPATSRTFCLICGRILKPAPVRFDRTDIIKITAMLASVILLVSIQVPVFALTEGPAQITAQTLAGEQRNIQLLPRIQGYTVEFVYRDKNFEEIAKQDASLVYAYQPVDRTRETIWVTVEIGSSTSLIHRWEVCLISARISHGRPVLATELALEDIQIQQNPPIIARYFAFQWVKTNETEAILYWYQTSEFFENDTTPQQRRVKISLIAYPATPQDIAEAENLLVPIATAIAQHWEPIKTWSQIALILSQNGAYFVAITTGLLAMVTVLYALKARQQKKSNTKAYQKLSQPAKQILDVVRETQETTVPTLHAIAATYTCRTGETIEKEKVLDRLSEAEKTGIVKNRIVSKEDEPTQIWRITTSSAKTPRIRKGRHSNSESEFKNRNPLFGRYVVN